MCIRDRCGWGRRRPTDLQRLGRGATLPRFDLPQTPPLPQSTPALSPKTPTNPSDEANFEVFLPRSVRGPVERLLFRRFAASVFSVTVFLNFITTSSGGRGDSSQLDRNANKPSV